MLPAAIAAGTTLMVHMVYWLSKCVGRSRTFVSSIQMTGHEQCRDLCHACDGAVISHEEIQVFRWCSTLGHIQNASVAITWGGPVGTPRVHFMAMITTLRMVSMQLVA